MKYVLSILVVLGLAVAPAFAQCGGGWSYGGCGSYGYGYSGCGGSYYSSGCGSYSYYPSYTRVYSDSCGSAYRVTRSSSSCGGCSPTTVYSNDQKPVPQKALNNEAPGVPSASPDASPGTSVLPPAEAKPPVSDDAPTAPQARATTSKFYITVLQPNGKTIQAPVKNGYMPQIVTRDGKRWAVYDQRIRFEKYREAYMRKGYIAYVETPKVNRLAMK